MKKFLIGILSLCLCMAALSAESSISLTVKSSQKESVVRINSRSVGEAPVTVTDLKPGFYIITVEKRGYYPWKSELALNDGDAVTLFAQMEPITGTLIIDGAPDRVQILIDDEPYEEPDSSSDSLLFDLIEDLIYQDRLALKIPEGRHVITLQKFGYENLSFPVTVIRNTLQQKTVSMERSPFDVSGFPSRQLRFNPANPGGLGTISVSYTVTAPGEATIEILNPYGDLLATRYAGPFVTWRNSFTWGGETDMMVPYMPDGFYTLRFTFTGYANDAFDQVIITRDIPVEIDSSITYQIASLGDTGLSAGNVPLALMSPAHSFLLCVGADIVCAANGDGIIGTPVPVGFEYSISDWTSFSVSDDMIPSADGESLQANVLTVGLKHLFVQDTVNAGVALRYQWLNQPVDIALYDRNCGLAAEVLAGVQNYAGYYAGFSAGVMYGSNTVHAKTGLALSMQRGIIAAEGFGTLYSKLSNGFVLNDGAETGASFHVILGNSPLILNTGVTAVFRPAEALQIIPQFSLTVLF